MSLEVKIAPAERRDLARAALLHDIGKLGVSNMVLDKGGKLTEAEWVQMRRHTEFTYQILKRVNGFSQFADMASSHHERPDGKGYHRAIYGGQLSPSARLLAVADKYEALTASRPYRDALLPQRALEILENQVGTGVDSMSFEALRAMLAKTGDQRVP